MHLVDADWQTSRVLVDIGQARGELLRPSGFAAAPDDSFVVSDAPFGVDRLQVFWGDGTALSAFQAQERIAPRLVSGSFILNGAGAPDYTGDAVLVSEPESGWLFTRYATDGRVLGHIGTLRDTGQERDPDVHLALNTGIPLASPTGGYWFVFQAGVPMARRYDAAGTLLFERHLEGVELDPLLRARPTTWPRRRVGPDRELPIVAPLVNAAAVDAGGQLYVALSVPYLYVLDVRGDKTRTLLLEGAGIVQPASLAFARNGDLLVTPGGYRFAVGSPAEVAGSPARNVAARGRMP